MVTDWAVNNATFVYKCGAGDQNHIDEWLGGVCYSGWSVDDLCEIKFNWDIK
jgi:hypothetical protein